LLFILYYLNNISIFIHGYGLSGMTTSKNNVVSSLRKNKTFIVINNRLE